VTGMKLTVAALLCVAGLFALPTAARAQKVVFVVRHAEKISETDQRLTEAGRARAARLARMLKDSGVGAVYATDTERTRDTVKPLADALGLAITLYDTGATMAGPADARPFVARLRKEHGNDTVLVAGHSNTIPDLLKALGCSEAVSIAADEYDDIFIVVPRADGTATLVRLRY